MMPVAFVLDWLWFTPKGRLRWIDPVKWLAFPLIYGGWTLVHGLATHWWPYGFVDVDALGLGRVNRGVRRAAGLLLAGRDDVGGAGPAVRANGA